MNHTLLRQHLIGSYISSKSLNPQYSKRAFARRLGVSHGALVEIMGGKRRVSERMAKKLCTGLLLNPAQQSKIFDLRSESVDEHIELKEDQFQVISDWVHFAVLNLITVERKNHSPAHFAERLGLGEGQLEIVLQRLLRLGLIEKSKAGHLKRTGKPLKTSDDISSISIRLYHRLMLELAVQKIDQTPVSSRDLTSLTIPVNTRKLEAAKKLIRDFQDELASLLTDDRADEVYAFNTQLIPLTKNPGRQKC